MHTSSKVKTLPYTVATVEVGLHEVASNDGLEMAIDRILHDDMPGFVIRAATIDERTYDHEVMVRVVTAKLNQTLDTKVQKFKPQRTYALAKRDPGIGHLHEDDMLSGPVVNVHTTELGGGKVLLSNSGPCRVERIETLKGYNQFYIMLTNSLSEGFVDPNAMSSNLHTTELSAGDTVIFPLRNSHGTVIHRFDTSSDRREAHATLIRPVLTDIW